jgi:hypothetical protein
MHSFAQKFLEKSHISLVVFRYLLVLHLFLGRTVDSTLHICEAILDRQGM